MSQEKLILYVLYALAIAPLVISTVAVVIGYRIKKEKYHIVYVLLSLSFVTLVASILINTLLFGMGCWGCSGPLIPQQFLIIYLLTAILWVISIQIKTQFMGVLFDRFKPFLRQLGIYGVKPLKGIIFFVKSFNRYNRDKYDNMVSKENGSKSLRKHDEYNKQ